MDMDDVELDIEQLMCCGGREINGLGHMGNPRDAVDFFDTIRASCIRPAYTDSVYNWQTGKYDSREHPEFVKMPAFVIFTQACHKDANVDEKRYGDWFSDYLLENDLGTVQIAGPTLNDNSGNLVKAFMWTPHRENFINWTRKKSAKPKKESI